MRVWLDKSIICPILIGRAAYRESLNHLLAQVRDNREALSCHQEALAIFEAMDDLSGVAATLDLLGMASYLSGDLISGTRYYERAVALFRELDDRQGLASSLATLTLRGATYQTNTMVPAVMSLPQVAPEGELALKIAREIGWRAGEAYALIFLGFCLGPQGEYSVALELGQDGLRLTAARRVGPTGLVLATDIASNLLKFVEEDTRRAGLTQVETQVMDGENLELAPDSFDAVISRVGLIYLPDQQKALTGMRRVLKPGGRVAAIVYSTAENNKFFSIPVSIIRRRAQLPAPLPGQPGPFSLGSPGTLEEAYRKAGFHNIQTRLVSAPVRMTSAAECVRFERESFGALHQMLSGLAEAEREAAWKEIERELRQFEGSYGFEGPCELLIVVGVK